MPVQPRRTVTLYLVLDGVDPSDVVLDREHSATYTVGGSGWSGTLVFYRPPGRQPSWLDLMRNELEPTLPARRNLTASALLLVTLEANLRSFIATFGHTRHRLNLSAVEPAFGLKVALNASSSDQLRSLDARSFDEQAVRSRRQVSRSARVDAFGIDVQRDLVSAVTATTNDSILGGRVSGKDALRADVRLPFEDIGELCQRALDFSASDTYASRFGWIDNIKKIDDENVARSLTDDLISTALHDPDTVTLEAPDIVDWADVDGFVYSFDPDAEPRDLHFGDLLAAGILDPQATVAARRSILEIERVQMAWDGAQNYAWSLLSCLSGTTEWQGDRYVLDRGSWYRVNASFVDSVDEYVSALPTSLVDYIPYTDRDKSLKTSGKRENSEGNYNARLARDPRYALLDKRNIVLPERSAVEPCDILTEDGLFVHVKRGTGSSSLSHLFAQGAVSADLYLREPRFRVELRRQLDKTPRRFRSRIALDQPDTASHGVVFAVISANPARPLPFFSRVSLQQAAQRITGTGMKVFLDRIPDHSS